MNFDAVTSQGVRDHLRGITPFFWQKQWLVVNDDGSRTEAGEGLREFAAERAAASDE